ncbi:hypothetical protein CLU79DRAFT_792644 [Phycomyces nitens]|nr:hypothetical protein CLU79DRAFT_792644 [Phycomyces nitens]
MLCSPEEYGLPRGEDQDDIVIIMQQEDVMFKTEYELTPIDKSLQLKRQLEYYFSRQNLVSDNYLTSHMDNNLYVPIDLIAGFKRVQLWTTDRDLIVSILRSSPVVEVDALGQKVRPALCLQRTTIILRDIESGTDKEEIIDFLATIHSSPIKNIKADLGMWYITFETEKDAVEMLKAVQHKIFKGKPIAARMKSEPMLRRIQTTLQSQRSLEPETSLEHPKQALSPFLPPIKTGSHTTPMPVYSYASILKRNPGNSSDRNQ